ncbi:hypothetical protein [Candidatus Nitrosocosmicus sp. R]
MKDAHICEINELNNSKKKSQILLNRLHDDIQKLSSEINLKQAHLGILDESFDDLLYSADFSNAKDHKIDCNYPFR